MVDLTLVCQELSEKACSEAVASALSPLWIFMGAVMIVLMILQLVWVGRNIKKFKKVWWVGIILYDVIVLAVWTLSYFLLPLLIRWFNIIKIG